MTVGSDKTREESLWRWLAKARDAHGEALHMERVENMVSSGGPDVDACLRGVSFKIELKTCPRPARAHTKIRPKFQPEQPGWHAAHGRAGGVSYLLIQVGSGGGGRRYLVPGRIVRLLDGDGMSEVDLASWSLVPPGILAGALIETAAGAARAYLSL